MAFALAVLTLSASTTGCDGPPPPEAPGFVTYGVVADGSGAPVAGVYVDLRSYPGPCASADTTLRVAGDAVATTDAAGRYETGVEVGVPGPVENRCLAVRAGRRGSPAGATLADVDVEARYEPPFDSLRVDARVP